MALLPARLRLSLLAVHAVAVATLVRSILFDRWITVVASLCLIAGALVAQRGKTLGIGVALGASVAFPAAFALGMAPPWFCLVGLVGALPFLLTSRSIARHDAGATALGATLAAGVGAAGALGWRVATPWLFEQFPALRPSAYPEHVGLAALVVLAAAAVAVTRTRSASSSAALARVATSGGARIGVVAESGHASVRVATNDPLTEDEDAPGASASAETRSA